MSKPAVGAFYRLSIRPRMDGTAMYVLYYLAWRHDENCDAARPSIKRIMADLDLNHGPVHDALNRLEGARLIRRKSGKGRGHATRYYLPWLKTHRLDPDSRMPIEWRRENPSAPPDISKKLHWHGLFGAGKCPVGGAKTSGRGGQNVQQAGHENTKTKKTDNASSATSRQAALRAVERLRGDRT